jgi:hypothetical protein
VVSRLSSSLNPPAESMIRKSGTRFSEKIMLKQNARYGLRNAAMRVP